MAKKRRVTVVLTEAARRAHTSDRLTPHLMAGENYFTCRSVTQNGSFLDMLVAISPAERELRFKLSIPISDVFYIVSAADVDLKQVGFGDEASKRPGVE